jgi:Cu-Zn family superoxide dismutase
MNRRLLVAGPIAALAVTAVTLSLTTTSDAAAGGADRTDAAGELVRYPLVVSGADTNPLQSGASARVHAVATESGKTVVKLHVSGFPASTTFGSHVHTRPCGATDPAAAGGHYMNVPVTAGGTASRSNEVWLDFTTDADGRATATAVVDWHFAHDVDHPTGASSVVVHRDPTSTGASGQPAAGVAGPRLGCLSVPFTS